MGKSSRRSRERSPGRRKRESPAPSAREGKFKAPTADFREYVFQHGTAKAAARNTEVVEALAGYVGTRLWPCSIEGAKAMQTLVEPTWSPPEKPSKLERTMDKITGLPKYNEDMTPVYEDKDPDIYKLEMQIYLEDYKLHKKNQREWVTGRAKIFHHFVVKNFDSVPVSHQDSSQDHIPRRWR